MSILGISNSTGQTLLMIFGAAWFLVIAWFLFIKAPQQRLTKMAPWAARRGLRFTPPSKAMGAHTIGFEISVIDGAVHGVPFELRSAYHANSRRAGIHGYTEIRCPSMVPAPVAFQMGFQNGPSVQAPDAVWTGDPMFDAHVRTRSDNANAARAWLQPPVRAALLAAVRNASLTIAYQSGELLIRMDEPIWREPMLDPALAVVAAAGHARLA